MTALWEYQLYEPVKAFLEAQGYEVKAEVSGCDVVAVRGKEPPVVVELKMRFNLELWGSVGVPAKIWGWACHPGPGSGCLSATA